MNSTPVPDGCYEIVDVRDGRKVRWCSRDSLPESPYCAQHTEAHARFEKRLEAKRQRQETKT